VEVGGACPFECCQYGAWTLRKAATIRRSPNAGAPALFTLAQESKVFADTGFVRVDTIGVVLVTQDYRDEAYDATYQKGDTILVLNYLGEGFVKGWWRGRAIETTILWDEASSGRPSTAPATMVRPARTHWWARVKDARGRRGWMDMNEARVGGADACG
jgi:hypothetical protein